MALGASWLFPVYHVRTSKIVDIPADKARECLKPEVLIRLSKLVDRFHEVPERAGTWIVVDKIRWFSMILETTYSAEFTKIDDGIRTSIVAAMGTRLANTWTAVPLEGNRCEIAEVVQVKVATVLQRPPDLHLERRFSC